MKPYIDKEIKSVEPRYIQLFEWMLYEEVYAPVSWRLAVFRIQRIGEAIRNQVAMWMR